MGTATSCEPLLVVVVVVLEPSCSGGRETSVWRALAFVSVPVPLSPPPPPPMVRPWCIVVFPIRKSMRVTCGAGRARVGGRGQREGVCGEQRERAR